MEGPKEVSQSEKSGERLRQRGVSGSQSPDDDQSEFVGQTAKM